jgi:hypothetical protein
MTGRNNNKPVGQVEESKKQTTIQQQSTQESDRGPTRTIWY